MNERCTFLRLSRELAKTMFGCLTPEALRTFFTQLAPDVPRLEGGAAALALHRVLTNGSLEPNAGEYPLNHAVLGGRVLGHETGYAVILKRPDMCAHIADGLSKILPETIEASLGQLAAANSEIVQSIQSSDVATLLAELTTLYQTAAARGEAVVLVREG